MAAEVLVVAPFRRLYEDVRLVIEEQLGERASLFEVVEADLQDAERLLSGGIGRELKVIVSRGGTAQLLEGLVSLPVVRIQVSALDALRPILRARAQGSAKHIGIAGFSNVIYGSEEIGRLLGLELEEILVEGQAEARARIEEAARRGMDFLVGDAVSVREARALGLPALAIDSGKQAILMALREAALIADVVRRDEFKSKMLAATFESMPEAVIVADESDEVTVLNHKAELILRRSRFELLGKHLKSVAPALMDAGLKTGHDTMPDILGRKYLVRVSRVEDGAHGRATIYTLQNISEVQRLESRIRTKLHAKGLFARYRLTDIVGESEACQNMKEKASRYALTDSTVLVTGESGTGKEMLVQGIHNASRRAKGPFVAVNCAAIPENLLEAELFGYEEGAFTGARKGGHQGVFELAHGGTLFLDEIGEMPVGLQPRLLRVLQEREVMPLGGERIIPIDVRVIAATNKNLLSMVREGTFREDLYYRLNILRISTPPLRERGGDIVLLARAIMERLKDLRPEPMALSAGAAKELMALSFPGNIRQLANLVERVILLAQGPVIEAEDLRRAYEDEEGELKREPIYEAEADLKRSAEATIERVLEEEGGSLTRAARRLGISRTTLWRRIKKENQEK